MSTPAAPRPITHRQAEAIEVLHAKLGRPCPDLGRLALMTFDAAGDLIVTLRTQLLALEGRAETR